MSSNSVAIEPCSFEELMIYHKNDIWSQMITEDAGLPERAKKKAGKNSASNIRKDIMANTLYDYWVDGNMISDDNDNNHNNNNDSSNLNISDSTQNSPNPPNEPGLPSTTPDTRTPMKWSMVGSGNDLEQNKVIRKAVLNIGFDFLFKSRFILVPASKPSDKKEDDDDDDDDDENTAKGMTLQEIINDQNIFRENPSKIYRVDELEHSSYAGSGNPQKKLMNKKKVTPYPEQTNNQKRQTFTNKCQNEAQTLATFARKSGATFLFWCLDAERLANLAANEAPQTKRKAGKFCIPIGVLADPKYSDSLKQIDDKLNELATIIVSDCTAKQPKSIGMQMEELKRKLADGIIDSNEFVQQIQPLIAQNSKSLCIPNTNDTNNNDEQYD